MDDDSFVAGKPSASGLPADESLKANLGMEAPGGDDADMLMGAIGIELDDSGPAPLAEAGLPAGGAGSITDEDIALITQNVVRTVKELVWERMDHILSHAITQAVEMELKSLIS
ncbi:MAG: hypothetical protein QMD09_06050, partial [Desulfatibacillaceae bacterium]|nr:hypothetical protein [Desulfatibacillaceae bacterium]